MRNALPLFLLFLWCLARPAAAADPDVRQPAAKTAVLLLPFEIDAAPDTNVGNLWALWQNLAAVISDNGALEAVALGNAPATLDSPSVAATARQAGAPVAVYGSFVVTPNNLKVDMYILEVAGEHVTGPLTTEGNPNAIVGIEAQMDRQLIEALGKVVPAVVTAPNYAPQRAPAFTVEPEPEAQPAPAVAPAPTPPSYTLPLGYPSPGSGSSYYYPLYPAAPPYSSTMYWPNIYAPPIYSPYGYGAEYPEYRDYGLGRPVPFFHQGHFAHR